MLSLPLTEYCSDSSPYAVFYCCLTFTPDSIPIESVYIYPKCPDKGDPKIRLQITINNIQHAVTCHNNTLLKNIYINVEVLNAVQVDPNKYPDLRIYMGEFNKSNLAYYLVTLVDGEQIIVPAYWWDGEYNSIKSELKYFISIDPSTFCIQGYFMHPLNENPE